jgi:hypothetical protein
MFLVLLSAAIAATSKPAMAQEAAGAFDTLSVQIRLLASVNRSTFQRYWDPGPAVEVNLQTPFYLGAIEAGVQYASFSANSPEQPDFKALNPYIGWGLVWQIKGLASWYNGARAGSFLMRFEDSIGNRTEQELSLALNSLVALALDKTWAVELTARYRVVFTHERLYLFHIGIGLSRSFASPRWLEEFLD